MKPQCVTVQMKVIEQYFHVMLFVMVNNVVITTKFIHETLAPSHVYISLTVHSHCVQKHGERLSSFEAKCV